MGSNAIVAGTGFEGRERIITKHCRDGMEVVLKRQPRNEYDPNAIAVYLKIPRFFGLLGYSLRQIGFLKASKAKNLAQKIDSGTIVTAKVSSFFAPADMDHPRVSLQLEY